MKIEFDPWLIFVELVWVIMMIPFIAPLQSQIQTCVGYTDGSWEIVCYVLIWRYILVMISFWNWLEEQKNE